MISVEFGMKIQPFETINMFLIVSNTNKATTYMIVVSQDL